MEIGRRSRIVLIGGVTGRIGNKKELVWERERERMLGLPLSVN